jgi:ribosomal protein L24
MLEKINPTFNRATRHKAIGQRVIVTAGSFKGYTGYVEAHNYVRNTFLVDLVTSMKRNIAAEDLIYQ